MSTSLTDELRAEGTAREVVRLVQNLRKSSGLEISDRITLGVTGPEIVASALTAFEDYVKQETLAVELGHRDISDPDGTAAHALDGEAITITLVKQK